MKMHSRSVNASIISAAHIYAGYAGENILNDVSLEIKPGAQLALLGPNGAGKSTLFKVIAGLLPVTSGQISIHGTAPGERRDCVAYVPQRSEVNWGFPATVADVVMMSRYGRCRDKSSGKKDDEQAVTKALGELKIIDLKDHPINNLSSGQQQRVFLARALAQDPHILLLDEPFNGIDAPTLDEMIAVLYRLHQTGITVIVSTHDLELAQIHFSDALLLNRKVIAFGTSKKTLTRENIRACFGKRATMVEGLMVVDECCPPAEQED
jgi:manganese/iron transport system ATP-binding protein